MLHGGSDVSNMSRERRRRRNEEKEETKKKEKQDRILMNKYRPTSNSGLKAYTLQIIKDNKKDNR